MTVIVPDIDKPDLTIAVLGAGTMGRGIAQIAAVAGITVLFADAEDGASVRGKQFVVDMLDRSVAKGRMSEADATGAKQRIEPQMAGDYSQFERCDVVIEAIIENLDIKREVFAQLEQATSENCLLVTNTSSLSVTAIAAECDHPERVAGFHFFNPVPLMKIVEVIAGVKTHPEAVRALCELATRMGHQGVVAADTPGFIVNHAGRGFGTEAFRIVDEGVADFATVDANMRLAANFRMGPFELMDLTGLDVTHVVMESIYNQFYDDPYFTPSHLGAQRVKAGLYGRKSTQGFYDYSSGEKVGAELPAVPEARHPTVWISQVDNRGYEKALTLFTELGADIDSGEAPAPNSVCIVTPLGDDATTCAVQQGLDATRTVALDTLFPLNKFRALMCTPVTTQPVIDGMHALLASDGVEVGILKDSPGFVAQRIVATIVNIGCGIAQRNIATPEDIDTAVQLGLNYPSGPLAMGNALEPQRIVTVLENIHRFYQEPRYRVNPWLKRRAALGLSLLHK